MDQPTNETATWLETASKWLGGGVTVVLLRVAHLAMRRAKDKQTERTAAETSRAAVEAERIKIEPAMMQAYLAGAKEVDLQQAAIIAAQAIRIEKLESDLKQCQVEMRTENAKWQAEVDKWRDLAQALREKNLELIWRVEALEGRAGFGKENT